MSNYDLGTSFDEGRPDRPVYSIGAVSRLLAVPAATLRTWQERYAVVVPERSGGGHRLYSRDQVEQLRFVVDQVADGLSPADAHRLLAERIADGRVYPVDGHGAGGNLMILLVERDPHAADFADFFLRTEGYDVTLVLDVDDAFAAFERTVPDLVVVDLLISAGRGLDLVRWLRERGDLPVLAISTLQQRDDAMDAGASAFLTKPVDPLQLVSTAQDLLGRSAFLRRRAVRP
jgi:CheY-like chemotaxis protein